MSSSKIRAALASCVLPPFRGLPVIIGLYFVLGFLLQSNNPARHGVFWDSDDYTILTHTLDWLKGQSWFDLVQYRMDPPQGVPLHFSRWNELPLGLAIQALRAMGFTWVKAATITAYLWPVLLFAGMLAALIKLAQSFLPASWTRATAWIALFATPLTFQFAPGRVDHHGLAALLTLLSLIVWIRMVERPENPKWGFAVGFLLALAQAIALETLPWILLIASGTGIWMLAQRRLAAAPGLSMGIALYVSSAFLLFSTRMPEQWMNPDPLAYSSIYVLLNGFIASSLALAALAAKIERDHRRIALVGAGGVAFAALFFSHFPALLAGPYGAMDPELAKTMFGSISEMAPLIARPQSASEIFLPLMGVVATIGLFPNKTRHVAELATWSLLLALQIVSLLLLTFYQARMATPAAMFSIVPLTLFLYRSLRWAEATWRGANRYAIQAGLLLLIGPFPSVLLPAAINDRPFLSGTLWFFVDTLRKDRCDRLSLGKTLNDAQLVGAGPLNIMNTPNEGAPILFRTPHRIFAAPYHTNVDGTLASERFFSTREPSVAERIARERAIDVVVMCKTLPMIYRSKTEEALRQEALEKGTLEKDEMTNDDKPATQPIGLQSTFAERLLAGELPAWLEPVPTPSTNRFLVFKVKR